MKNHVSENVKGYRRGVVLGLTMAETMFLLVFVLLLIMNGVLQTAKNEKAELEKEIAALKKELVPSNEENVRKLSPQEQQAVNALVRSIEDSLINRKPNDLVDALKKIDAAQNIIRNEIPKDWAKAHSLEQTS